MTTAVIAFTRRGTALGRSLADALGGTLHVPARFAPEVGAEAYASLEGWTAWAWARRVPAATPSAWPSRWRGPTPTPP